MAICQKIRIKKRQFCVGDLRERITLQDRDIQPPGDINFTESFTAPLIVSAAVKTLSGVEIFDNTNIVRIATHDFIIRFQFGITQEKWILWRNERYDILVVENLEGRNQWLKLRSAVRGADTLVVNDA